MTTRSARAAGLAPLAVGLVAAAVGPAFAQEREGGSERDSWALTLHGGALVPLSPMDLTHQAGMLAGTRLGWTSPIRLGVEVAATYSPLPRIATEGVTTESHYATLMVGPTYALGSGLLRFTVAAEGGVAAETRRRIDGDLDERSQHVMPAVAGAFRMELHVVRSGALVFGGGATRTFVDESYFYASGEAGLILTF
jgi:hypothetical protein